MKKLFGPKIIQSNKDTSHSYSSASFIGKAFVIGKHTVTVEDTIAEGKLIIYKIKIY